MDFTTFKIQDLRNWVRNHPSALEAAEQSGLSVDLWVKTFGKLSSKAAWLKAAEILANFKPVIQEIADAEKEAIATAVDAARPQAQATAETVANVLTGEQAYNCYQTVAAVLAMVLYCAFYGLWCTARMIYRRSPARKWVLVRRIGLSRWLAALRAAVIGWYRRTDLSGLRAGWALRMG